MTTRNKESYCIQSVENALTILEALSEEDDEISLTRLSERTGMNKATVFRMLATLDNRGYVEREEGSEKYRLGPTAYEIGQRLLSRMVLLRKARPAMEKLARECNEAVYLVVRRNDEALYLDMADGAQQVKIISLAGRRYPLAACAAGRIFLAFEAGDTPRRRGRRSNGEGPNLPAEAMETIRQRGYGLDRNGLGEGITSVAVPLLAGSGDVVGALALLGPEFRLPQDKLEGQILPALREAGQTVSSKLGYLEPYLGEGHAGGMQ